VAVTDPSTVLYTLPGGANAVSPELRPVPLPRPAGREDRVVRVAIGTLRPGPAVRQEGLNEAHMAALAELAGAWPPLLVTPSGRIVDGHYRYRAACRLGISHLDCVIFDGDDDAAFVEAVSRNVHCGLPLSVRERKNAAARILRHHADWSNRKIGRLCGLAHETVGRLRGSLPCQGGDIDHVDNADGANLISRAERAASTRTRIVAAIEANPSASLRQLARVVGTTHETVRTVRRRLDAAELVTGRWPERVDHPTAPSPSSDAAFTSTEWGSAFASWFEQTSIADEWRPFVPSVPISRVYEIVDEAQRRASAWASFASALSARVSG
jgi:ParB-like chromosome segregation protein Spo0J